MAEWSNAVDSKSIVLFTGYPGFESLSLRQFDQKDAWKQRLFSYPAEMQALPAIDFAEMTMVSSFYIGKCKIFGIYIQCRFWENHFKGRI